MSPCSLRRALAVVTLTLLAALPAPAGASARIAGNVWIIDDDARTVTIIDAGRRITFSYGDETIIRRGSTDRSVNDLRRGDRIVVTLAEETPDALRARVIAIAGPPAPRRGGGFVP
jgi:hypothetical protein